MPRISAFGTLAQRWCSRLPHSVDIVAADHSGAIASIAEATERRKRGELFYAAPLVSDTLAALSLAVSGPIIQQYTDRDQRRGVMNSIMDGSLQINGVSLEAAALPDHMQAAAMQLLIRLSDGLLLRSWTEWERLYRLFGLRRQTIQIALARNDVPAPPHERSVESIVIWAPNMPADHTGVFAFALEELRWPVLIVAAGSASFATRARFVDPHVVREALGSAALIIDASLDDPSDAIGLSAYEVPLATTLSSGAHEFVAGTLTYNPRDWRSILDVATAGLASRGPRIRVLPELDDAALQHALRDTRPLLPVDPPLVTILIPTYNRRHLLPLALQSVAAQSYPNVECIVVNDAGVNVDDIVAEYPFAKVVNKPKNKGPIDSFNTSIRLGRGKYWGVFADDDLIFPDYLARAVNALERTGAAVAHGNVVGRFIEKRPDGTYHVYGFNDEFNAHGHLDLTTMHYQSEMPLNTMLIRKSVFDELGLFDEELETFQDYEMLYRLARSHDFLHVDNVTGEVIFRTDNDSFTERLVQHHGKSLSTVFERHPVGDRPVVQAERARVLHFYENLPGKVVWNPTIRLPHSE